VQEDGVQLNARWSCPGAPGRLRIVLGFLDSLPPGHVHVALLRLPGGTVQRTARASAPVLEVEAQPGPWAGAGRFLRFVPPPRVIEPLIAASIAAMALENLWALRAPAVGGVWIIQRLVWPV
jgi:hypothetical protein